MNKTMHQQSLREKNGIIMYADRINKTISIAPQYRSDWKQRINCWETAGELPNMGTWAYVQLPCQKAVQFRNAITADQKHFQTLHNIAESFCPVK